MNNRMKRQPPKWRKKSFQIKYIIESKYSQYTKNYNSTTKNHPIKKWVKYLNRHFSKEDTQITNKYMKRYFAGGMAQAVKRLP
jgi:hypothetical protein